MKGRGDGAHNAFAVTCSFPSCYMNSRWFFTMDEWMKSSSSWKERTAEKPAQTPRSLSLHYCVGVCAFFFLYCSISQTRSCYFCCHLKKPQLFSLSLPFSGRCPHSSSTSWFRFCRPVLTSMQKLNSCSQFSPHSHQITKLDKTLMHHTPLASLWRVKTERKSAVCDSL